MALDIDPRPARNSMPAGAQFAYGGGVVTDDDEYEWSEHFHDWFRKGMVPAVPEAPQFCPIVKRNGHPCSANPTRTGLCLGHSNQMAPIVARLLGSWS